MEESVGEQENQSSIKLESDVLNSIRHTFQTLDETNSRQVAKSKLQVLCASICRDIGVTFDTQHLTDFKSSSTTITFQDFIQYLQSHLLVKGGQDVYVSSCSYSLEWQSAFLISELDHFSTSIC